MTDRYVFGEYFSQSNLVAAGTADRAKAKWRSQYPVPDNYNDFDEGGRYLYIDNENPLNHVVHLTDLEYQLKTTQPIGDEFWLEKPSGLFWELEDQYAGRYLTIKFRHAPQPELVLDSTNPNSDRFIVPVATPKQLPAPTYISFAEERLDLGIDYGAVGGMSFSTEIIEVADDREQRNGLKVLPLGRWQLGDRTIADSEIDKLEELTYLKKFHLDRLGSFQGFRFKDWSDYQGKEQYIATGDGIKTQFQLRKGYYAGDAVTWRPIQKPVEGTVDIFVDGVNTPWQVDHATGILSNPTPLPNGAILSANFEFDVPVWFESDKIDFRLEAYEPETERVLYRLGSVFVREKKIPFTIPWDIEPSQEISEELDLGIVYETVEEFEITNLSQELQSGWTKKEAKREDQRLSINLGSRQYLSAEKDKILGYFWNARGSRAEFPFSNLGKSYKGRFDQDSLNLKFLAKDNFDSLFELSALKIKVKEEIILTIPTLPEFLVDIATFEISDFGITDNAQAIESNSYATYGGSFGSGSSGNSGSGGSAGSAGSGGFGSSFGSADVVLNNVTNGFTPIVQSINFIEDTPVLAVYGFQNLSGSSNDRRYPYVAIPMVSSNGQISFQVQDPFSNNPNVASNTVAYADYNGAVNSQLVNIDDVLITAANDENAIATDPSTFKFWAYAIQKNGSQFNYQTAIVQNNAANNNTVDSQISYPSNGGTYLLQGGVNNLFNEIQIFGKFIGSITSISSNPTQSADDYYGDHAGVSSLNLIPMSVMQPDNFTTNERRRLKPFSQNFFYIKGFSLYKATSNTEAIALATYNSAPAVRLTAWDASTGDSFLVYSVASDNPIFPHEPLNNGDPSLTYYIVVQAKLGATDLTYCGSFEMLSLMAQTGLTQSNLSQIFTRNSVCCKGIMITNYRWLIDLINGGIINLKINSFFQTSMKMGADKNGFSFYSTTQNKIGYLAVNRA